MLERALQLRQVCILINIKLLFFSYFSRLQAINLFVASADQLYGPITIIRQDGLIIKKIPWSAFRLLENDWKRVADAQAILAVCPTYPHTPESCVPSFYF
jgi:hypothetical protein